MNIFNAEFDLIDKTTETQLKLGLASLAGLLMVTGTLLYLHANTFLG